MRAALLLFSAFGAFLRSGDVQLGPGADWWLGGALLSKMAALLRAIVASW